MAIIVQIADAIVQHLHGQQYVLPFTARRDYRPRLHLSDMPIGVTQVVVVPRSVVITDSDRTTSAYDYSIDIAILQRLDPNNMQARLDTLLTLTEQILSDLDSFRPPSVPQAICTELRNEPLYAVEHLDELHQFTSIITAIFRYWA